MRIYRFSFFLTRRMSQRNRHPEGWLLLEVVYTQPASIRFRSEIPYMVAVGRLDIILLSRGKTLGARYLCGINTTHKLSLSLLLFFFLPGHKGALLAPKGNLIFTFFLFVFTCESYHFRDSFLNIIFQ